MHHFSGGEPLACLKLHIEHDGVACPIAVKLLTGASPAPDVLAQQQAQVSVRLAALHHLVLPTQDTQQGTTGATGWPLAGHTWHPHAQLARPQPPDCKCQGVCLDLLLTVGIFTFLPQAAE